MLHFAAEVALMRCPSCHCHVAFDKGLFRGMRCKECSSTLWVSQTYIRVLMLLSLLAAQGLLWVVDVRKLFYPTLGVPFGLSFTLARVSRGLFHFDGVGANRAAHGGTHPSAPRLVSGYYS